VTKEADENWARIGVAAGELMDAVGEWLSSVSDGLIKWAEDAAAVLEEQTDEQKAEWDPAVHLLVEKFGGKNDE
jgi:hypothetical protein